MLVPLLVLLKIPQNVKAANFRLRINDSWFLLKRHPRFMLSVLHTNCWGRKVSGFWGARKGQCVDPIPFMADRAPKGHFLSEMVGAGISH